jgi:hypothetical protein
MTVAGWWLNFEPSIHAWPWTLIEHEKSLFCDVYIISITLFARPMQHDHEPWPMSKDMPYCSKAENYGAVPNHAGYSAAKVHVAIRLVNGEWSRLKIEHLGSFVLGPLRLCPVCSFLPADERISHGGREFACRRYDRTFLLPTLRSVDVLVPMLRLEYSTHVVSYTATCRKLLLNNVDERDIGRGSSWGIPMRLERMAWGSFWHSRTIRIVPMTISICTRDLRAFNSSQHVVVCFLTVKSAVSFYRSCSCFSACEDSRKNR